ncbi:hypothetical protein QL996_13265 [Planococcus sp. APC 4015]|nr:hypothetical protein [Planococcus sp. APC 4015]
MTEEPTTKRTYSGRQHVPEDHGRHRRHALIAVAVFVLMFFGLPALILVVIFMAPTGEQGETTINVGGDLRGDGFTIRSQGAAWSDPAEASSWIELTIDGRTTGPEIPLITAQIGTDGPKCKSEEGAWWHPSLRNYETQTFVVLLRCSPFVPLSQFHANKPATIADH